MNGVNSDIPQLLRRLHEEGTDTLELLDWRHKSIAAIILSTESGASYIIEPKTDEPSLVTRISEAPPLYDQFRMSTSDPIVRRQGRPSDDFIIGVPVDIDGLPRKGTEFDPESSYKTTSLISIKYIEADD